MAHLFDQHNAFLSEGGALAVVVQEFPETPHQMRDNTDFRFGCGKAKRGCASRVPPSSGETARRTRGVLVVRATPPFWALVRHREVVGGPPLGPPTPPGSGRSLSPQ